MVVNKWLSIKSQPTAVAQHNEYRVLVVHELWIRMYGVGAAFVTFSCIGLVEDLKKVVTERWFSTALALLQCFCDSK